MIEAFRLSTGVPLGFCSPTAFDVRSSGLITLAVGLEGMMELKGERQEVEEAEER
jgi:hypothetical protein